MGELIIERDVRVRAADGAELLLDIYRPHSADPVPATLGAYPYRKDDLMGAYTEHPRRWFAERGYASVLLDLRGTGGSSGRYHPAAHAGAEAADLVAVIGWLAAQPWCDGSVGMYGLSYGGIAALQAAAAQPPALKAVAPIYGGDQIGDLLRPGGAVAGFPLIAWATFMAALNALPPSSRDAAGRWREVWQDRLQADAAPMVQDLPALPADHPRWTEGTADAGAIRAATLLIGGWQDIFADRVPPVLDAVAGPRQAVVGPWVHVLPHLSPLEPVEHLDLIGRWFDVHLRGRADLAEPDGIRYALQSSTGAVAGWRTAAAWPPAGAEEQRLALRGDGALAPAGAARTEATDPTGEVDVAVPADPSVGVTGNPLDPLGNGIGYPVDAHRDAIRAACFTAPAVTAATEVAGTPRAELALRPTGQPTALAVFLDVVRPDGRSLRMTRGAVQLDGHEDAVTVQLRPTAFRLEPGESVRLVLAAADFPYLLLVGEPATVVADGTSALVLPVDAAPTPVEAPAAPTAGPEVTVPMFLEAPFPSYAVEEDRVTGTTRIHLRAALNARTPDGGTYAQTVAIDGTAGPLTGPPSLEAEVRVAIELPDHPGVEAVARGSLTAAGGLALSREVREDGEVVDVRSWDPPAG